MTEWIDYDDGHAGGFPHAHTDAAAELREALEIFGQWFSHGPNPKVKAWELEAAAEKVLDAARTIALPILEAGEFLSWLADRLVNVYGESENVDFVRKLRQLAAISTPTPVEES